MEIDNREFCFHLEQWKEWTGKKEKDFCKMLGIHPNTLVNWKKGKSAPQAEHIKLICENLRINEADLAPLSFYTAQNNENKLYYRTQQLQRYAKRKGLDDEFYKRITSEPYFLKEFPFSSARDRFYQLNCPEYLAEDEEYWKELHSYPLTKFEFQDDCGHIIMLTEEDIDFLIELQRKSERLIRDEFYLKRRRDQEKHLKEMAILLADCYTEDGAEINPDELLSRLTEKNDFTEHGNIDIHERFEEYSKTHNLETRIISAREIEKRHPAMTEEEAEAWKQHYLAGGMMEKEAEEKLKDREAIRQRLIRMQKDAYGLSGGGENDKGTE